MSITTSAHIKAISGRALSCLRGERWVFTGVNFDIGAGEVLFLRGPNGSGKSSLLRMMAGLLAPSEGKIHWRTDTNASNAENVEEPRDTIAYIGHQDGLKAALSATENLAFWARLWRGAAREKVEELLVQFGIAHLAAMPARTLSAGERKRLSLARLLLRPHAPWLLDEPTTALDSSGVEILAALIATHRNRGGIVAIATHDALAGIDGRTLTFGGAK